MRETLDLSTTKAKDLERRKKYSRFFYQQHLHKKVLVQDQHLVSSLSTTSLHRSIRRRSLIFVLVGFVFSLNFKRQPPNCKTPCVGQNIHDMQSCSDTVSLRPTPIYSAPTEFFSMIGPFFLSWLGLLRPSYGNSRLLYSCYL